MTTLQSIQHRDLSFAYQIAKAEHSKISGMCAGHSADDIGNGFYGKSMAGILHEADLTVDQIAAKLDKLHP